MIGASRERGQPPSSVADLIHLREIRQGKDAGSTEDPASKAGTSRGTSDAFSSA
jgi:hypothetical protein